MFYRKPIQDIVKELNTNIEHGLSQREVGIRLLKFGKNLLPSPPTPPLILKFFEQFKNIFVLILIIASLISILVGDALDAVVIFAIVILNSSIGFAQEVQAQKTLESLKEKEVLFTLVLRDNQTKKIAQDEVVIGDILILEEGQKVPADARIVEEFSLTVDESILTGESLSVSKQIQHLNKELSLADQSNMIFKDTQIMSGRGKAIVTATGKETQIGKIAQFLQTSAEEKTPLTIQLNRVAKMLTIVITVIALGIFYLNIYHQIHLVESLLVSISLAVAAIPEGLPAIVTIVLSLGVKRLAEKKSIIKKLPAVETLGAVRIIATDKTGTLTQNKINVVRLVLPDSTNILLEGKGYQILGKFYDQNRKRINPAKNSDLLNLLTAAVLANDASLDISNKEKVKIIGDSTEGALLVAASRSHINIEQLKNAKVRIFEIPFTSDRKMMSVVVKDRSGNYFLYAKGAPEKLLAGCNLSKAQKMEVLKTNNGLADKGLRSLAIAAKKLSTQEVRIFLKEKKIKENKLQYLGILAMQDPLRSEVAGAIKMAAQAGIRTIMITGDHQATAITIARQAGIIGKEAAQILTEDDVVKMSKNQLAKAITNGVSVFARISPMGKLKIIEAIKSIPDTQVAVTGDGVNDAPALKSSHIGIAMGQTGTDITREVADMVITDDNYATIIDAIREGRTIFANLVKFIRYLISCNLSEVIVVTLGVVFRTPLPLLPIQILWINLVTDGFPALALGMEPAESDVMKMPPRDLHQGILHKKRWVYMIIEGSIIGLATFALFLMALKRFSYPTAQSMTFATLAFAQLVHAFNNRSTRKSIFELGIFSNKYLVWATLGSIVLQILVIQTNFGNVFFKTEKLLSQEWLYIGLFSLIPLGAVEIKKQLRFRFLP